MPSHDEHKSSAQIEREIEAQRSRVSSTIDEIQEQLSPGQLVDQFMSMTKSGGGDFAKNLGHAISNNPLPVALLGASLVWLMSGAGSRDQHKATPRSPQPMGYRPGDSDALRAEAFEGYRGDHRSPLDRAMAVGEDVAARVGEVADEVGGRIGETMHGLSDTAGQIGESLAEVGDQVRHTFDDVRHQASRATDSMSYVLENQPLVAGALAFAAGAALGAIVPRLPQENELMGEAADEVKDAVQKAAAPIVEEGQHLLDEGKAKLEEGREALEDGLSGAKDQIDKAMGNNRSPDRM